MAQIAEEPPPPAEGAPVKKEKKKKLSKAEKRRLRAIARLKLQQQLIRDRLLREIALCNKSLKHGKYQWEELCKVIKLKEFRGEVEKWGEKTERLLEKKDGKIDALLKTLEETQELQGRSFSKHLDQLQYLTKCHETLRGAATAIYELQASEMVQDFLWQSSSAEEIQDLIREKTENITHSTNVVTKDRLRKNYENYMEWKFDEVSSEIEKRYILRNATVEKMQELQKQLLLFLRSLQGDIVDTHKTKKFLNFMERQRNYVKESNKLNEVERISLRTISELKQELLNIESESNRKYYGLKLEQAYFLEVRSIIKNSIARNKQLTHEKLLAEASESYRVINKLKEFVKNGELLLNVGACCRKHQTEKEKVLPINNEAENFDSEFMFKMKFDLFKYLDITEEELSGQISLLNNFWHRCSNVRFHNLLLMEERRKLNEENEKYRNIIRSMKKSDDVAYILESLEIKQIV